MWYLIGWLIIINNDIIQKIIEFNFDNILLFSQN